MTPDAAHVDTTAAFRFEDGWWCDQAVELPEAFGQGRTLEEARESVIDAVRAASKRESLCPRRARSRSARSPSRVVEAGRPGALAALTRAEPLPGKGRGSHEGWQHTETGAKALIPRHRELPPALGDYERE